MTSPRIDIPKSPRENGSVHSRTPSGGPRRGDSWSWRALVVIAALVAGVLVSRLPTSLSPAITVGLVVAPILGILAWSHREFAGLLLGVAIYSGWTGAITLVFLVAVVPWILRALAGALPRFDRVDACALGFLTVALASLAWTSADWPAAIEKAVLISKAVAIFFVVRHMFPRQGRWIVVGATIGAAQFIARGVVAWAIGGATWVDPVVRGGTKVLVPRPFLPDFDPNYTSASWLVPIGFLLIWSLNQQGWKRFGAAAGALTLTGGIVLSGSRGTLFGLFALGGTMVFLRGWRLHRKVLVVAVAIAGVLLAAQLFPGATGRLNARGTNLDSYHQRLDSFRSAAASIGESPLLGAGVKGWYSDRAGEGALVLETHNTPLEVLTDFGLVGFAFLLPLYLGAFRSRWLPARAAWIGLFIALLSISAVSQQYFWLALALATLPRVAATGRPQGGLESEWLQRQDDHQRSAITRRDTLSAKWEQSLQG